MRVFVTGASGYIGSAVVPELRPGRPPGRRPGPLRRLGREGRRGRRRGPARRHDRPGRLLRAAAAESDAVVHLAFDHATVFAGRFPDAAATDLAVVRAFGDALAGTGKALVGIGIRRTRRRPARRRLRRQPALGHHRGAWRSTPSAACTPIFMAIPSVTHSSRDKHGFIPQMIRIARERGVVRLRRRRRQPLARRPRPGRRPPVPAGAGQGAGRSPAVRRRRGRRPGPADRRDDRAPPRHPGGQHPGRAGGGALHRLPVRGHGHHDAERGDPRTAGLGADRARNHRRPRRRPLLRRSGRGSRGRRPKRRKPPKRSS